MLESEINRLTTRTRLLAKQATDEKRKEGRGKQRNVQKQKHGHPGSRISSRGPRAHIGEIEGYASDVSILVLL